MIHFKKATPENINEISDLVNSAYRGEESKIGWTTEAHFLGGQRTDHDQIREMISSDDSEIQLAFLQNNLIGCFYIRKDPDSLYFGMLTVRPSLQGKGHGKKLLEEIQQKAIEWNYKKIVMTVISLRHELISFYQRKGFYWTGETRPFPSHDPRFGIPKTELIFHVFEKNLF